MPDDPRNDVPPPVPMSRSQEPGRLRLHGYIVGSKVDIALRPPDAEKDVMLIRATPNSSCGTCISRGGSRPRERPA